ncbi:hypothetical protein GCM10010393_20450 [Streptomyces gobitricini]|uniref:GAF domain-containing protein n=1 Tax=Streptomyces gobitricini TaxID=68211 RepID=A0ABP5YXQ1_9ACTN
MHVPEHAEAVEIRAALLRLRRTTGLPIAFGGPLNDGRRMRITEVSGALSTALAGLAIGAGHGLGGKAIVLARPCAVTDYALARHISHEYDGAVAAEGLRSVLAVPVVVRRRVRGVLYGGLREPMPLGDRVFDAAVAAARDVEQALVVRDEVRQSPGPGRAEPLRPGPGRAGPAQAGPAQKGPGRSGSGVPGTGHAGWEAVREAHGDLRALAPRIADPALRAELLAVCGRLAAAQVPSGAPGTALAPREVDVLAAVASGATTRWRRSGWGCGPRRSRATCGPRCGSWARARGWRRWWRPGGRGCCRERHGGRGGAGAARSGPHGDEPRGLRPLHQAGRFVGTAVRGRAGRSSRATGCPGPETDKAGDGVLRLHGGTSRQRLPCRRGTVAGAGARARASYRCPSTARSAPLEDSCCPRHGPERAVPAQTGTYIVRPGR